MSSLDQDNAIGRRKSDAAKKTECFYEIMN